MPTPRKNEVIKCKHFTWKLVKRNGVYYADGRTNTPNIGRHSLGVRTHTEAIRLLADLDIVRAADFGIIPRPTMPESSPSVLLLADGRKLYEEHIGRARAAGGVRPSTRKRYRTVFDKFEAFAQTVSTTTWNAVDDEMVTAYVAHLEESQYARKTILNEVTTLKQCVKWLIDSGHLLNKEPSRVKIRKADSMPAYCYRPVEVKRMVEYCSLQPKLKWLRDIVVALACTGLPIAELASLRWRDIDLERRLLHLTDESGRGSNKSGGTRQTKSGRSRTFPLHPDLRQVLDGISHREGHVLRSSTGRPLRPDRVRDAFVESVIKPLAPEFPATDGSRGFADGRLHSFRRFFCSVCCNENVSGRTVMDWLGHSDSEMIRRYYHLHDDESRRRMEALDSIGNGAGPSVGNNKDPEEKGESELPAEEAQ